MAHSVAYPKIIALGGVGIGSIFDEEVEITEKLDGSQFGFGMVDGELVCRSKGKEQDIDNPDKMFIEGVEYIKSRQHLLPPDHFFYGEYLQKPRHSTLAYNTTPRNHIALFGVMAQDESGSIMLSHDMIQEFADKFDIDAMPLLYQGKSNPEHVLELMERESYLGGQNIEGVVVKNYKPWLFMNQILFPVMAGKYVSEKFKETHNKDWSKLNTGKGQMGVLKDKYRAEARWHKAVMRLKEEGKYTQSLKDIGELIKIVKADLVLEEKENIKNDLWKLFKDDVVRYSTSGLPEFYKKELLLGEANDTGTKESDNSNADADLGKAG